MTDSGNVSTDVVAPTTPVPPDIEIAEAATIIPIVELARDRLGIDAADLVPYGHTKAKVSLAHLRTLTDHPDGNLVLVTAMSPTPAGEGKTTTSVGLADGLSLIGEKAMVALREPSMGPVFGIKGGAAGGGYAQVVPMVDINLNFTGDFAAIAAANNLLAPSSTTTSTMATRSTSTRGRSPGSGSSTSTTGPCGKSSSDSVARSTGSLARMVSTSSWPRR